MAWLLGYMVCMGVTRVWLLQAFRAMERKDLQHLCVQKRIKAIQWHNQEYAVAALEASLCSDVAAGGGGSAAEEYTCRGWC